ncbi:MAG: hypothetical protein K0U45_01035, partial [Alphaproteobacteria bacterium]|nr:hypothetical protein [Alphaproteobacteria bacterium]
WLLMEHDFNNKGISKDTRRNRLLLKILVRTQIDYIIVKPFWFLYTWLYAIPNFIGLLYFKIRFYKFFNITDIYKKID